MTITSNNTKHGLDGKHPENQTPTSAMYGFSTPLNIHCYTVGNREQYHDREQYL